MSNVTPYLGLELFTPIGVGWREDATAGVAMDFNMEVLDAVIHGIEITPSSSIEVNSASIPNPNFNGTTPAAPSGYANVVWQVSGSSVSACAVATPAAGALGNIQFNAGSSSFGASASFSINPATGEVQLISTAVSQTNLAALSVQGNAQGDDIQDWYSNGSTIGEGADVYIDEKANLVSSHDISAVNISASGNLTLPSKTQNTFFAAPDGSPGSPSFRAIVAADVPTLNQSTTGTAANLSGMPALPNGTTATTQTAGDNSTKLATTAYSDVATALLVPKTTTVNGHALSSNVVVSASDLTTGTLPHAQLPTLLSGDIPNNAANTSGTAANLSGTPALPNGTTATTQTAGDNSTKLATTAYSDTATALLVPKTTTVNGHALSGNVTVSASDLTTGTLPHGQLPTLLSGDIPNNAANTSGTASNLSGTPALPNGTTATTQTQGDDTANLATTAFVYNAAATVLTSAQASAATLYIPLSTMIANGDMLYENASLGPARLPIGSAGQVLTSNGSDPIWGTTFNQTSAVAWTWANTTPASSITTNASPTHQFSENYWTGAASAADTWTIGSSLAAGTNGASTLTFTHSGSTGMVYVKAPSFCPTEAVGTAGSQIGLYGASQNLTLNGNGSSSYCLLVTFSGTACWSLQTGNGVGGNHAQFPSTGTYGWSASTIGMDSDIQIGRNSAGIVGIGSGLTLPTDWSGGVKASGYIGSSVALSQLASVGTVTVTPTLGSASTWTYVVVAKDANGYVTAASSAFSTTTGAATLDGTHFNTLTWTAIAGAYSYDVYRTVAATSPTTLGKIGSVLASVAVATTGFKDNGLAGDSTTAPTINTTGSVSLAGKASTYNGIATVSNGVPSEYATVDLTAQTAAISAHALYTPAASGMFRVSWSADITTAATTSSVLGGTNGFQVTYTSPTDSVAKTTVSGNSVTSAANTTGTALGGTLVVYAKAGVAMTFSYDYTSVGVTAMSFEIHCKVEAL